MRVDKVRQSEVSSGEVLSDERFKIKLIPKGPKVWKYLRVTTRILIHLYYESKLLQIKFYPTIYVKLYVSRMISIEYCIEYQMILS